MPQSPEFATWAAGPVNQETAECNEKLPAATIWGLLAWSALFFAVSRMPSVPVTRPLWRAAEVTLFLLVPCVTWGVTRLVQTAVRSRIAADGVGLQVSGILGRRTIPWGEVTNYYLRWPSLANPPALIPPAQERKPGFQMHSPNWLRIPEAEELIAVIETRQGTYLLRPGLAGRENLCRMVRAKARHSASSAWDCPAYAVMGESREFRYAMPAWRTVLSLNFAGCVQIYVFLVYAFMLTWPGLARGPHRLEIGLILAGTWFMMFCACLVWLWLWLRRDFRRRQDEVLTLSAKSLVWEKNGRRVEIEWTEIRGIRPVPYASAFQGPQGDWCVHSTWKEISFSTKFLGNGGGLPALIYERAPQLRETPAILTSQAWPELHGAGPPLSESPT